MAELPSNGDSKWLDVAERPTVSHLREIVPDLVCATVSAFTTSFWEVSIPDKMLKQFSMNFNGIKVCSRKPITHMPNYPHTRLPTVNQGSSDL